MSRRCGALFGTASDLCEALVFKLRSFPQGGGSAAAREDVGLFWRPFDGRLRAGRPHHGARGVPLPKPETRNPKPETLPPPPAPRLETRNPQPGNRTPETETWKPKPETRNLKKKPKTRKPQTANRSQRYGRIGAC